MFSNYQDDDVMVWHPRALCSNFFNGYVINLVWHPRALGPNFFNGYVIRMNLC